MKKILIALLFIITSAATAFAQEDNGQNWEKIKAIKVGYINDHVHLTAEQSSKFWPVYDGYQQERRNKRHELMDRFMAKHPGTTKNQARAQLDGDLDYQAAELELKRKYKDRLLQIISPQQLNQLYEAERDFRKMLLDQIRTGK